jgi:signal transduction histidine kinase
LDEVNQKLLLDEADRVEEKYKEERDALLLPAGIGMTASFAMHEIEKLIPRMQETVKEKPVNDVKIQRQVEELKDYSEGLLSVLRKASNVHVPVYDAIKVAASNYESKMRARHIHLLINSGATSLTVKCDRRLLTTVVMNIIDNSIYWLDTIYSDFKGIYIGLNGIENGVSVVIVDNGPGFKEGITEIVMPYYSRKRNGIGIGMYLVDTIMINYGRLNVVFDRDRLAELGVPDAYSGAAVELVFNKNQ